MKNSENTHEYIFFELSMYTHLNEKDKDSNLLRIMPWYSVAKQNIAASKIYGAYNVTTAMLVNQNKEKCTTE